VAAIRYWQLGIQGYERIARVLAVNRQEAVEKGADEAKVVTERSVMNTKKGQPNSLIRGYGLRRANNHIE
jgi:hypothetical protein